MDKWIGDTSGWHMVYLRRLLSATAVVCRVLNILEHALDQIHTPSHTHRLMTVDEVIDNPLIYEMGWYNTICHCLGLWFERSDTRWYADEREILMETASSCILQLQYKNLLRRIVVRYSQPKSPIIMQTFLHFLISIFMGLPFFTCIVPWFPPMTSFSTNKILSLYNKRYRWLKWKKSKIDVMKNIQKINRMNIIAFRWL